MDTNKEGVKLHLIFHQRVIIMGLQWTVSGLIALILSSGHALTQPQCARITATACQGLGYNMTHMPNFVGHRSQEETIVAAWVVRLALKTPQDLIPQFWDSNELNKLNDLLSSNCSPFLRLFLCSLYIPLCSEHIPGAVPACKGLCEEVNRNCMTLQTVGSLQLNCSIFPEPPDLCMQKPPDDKGLMASMDASASFMISRLQSQLKCPKGSMRVSGVCIQPFMRPSQDDRKYKDDELIVEIWILTWSILAIIVVVFALLTFVIQPKRFRWPARPILFLTVSGLATSLLYFMQWTLATLRYTEPDDIKMLDNRSCMIFALMHTYFDFLYSLWWCTFSFVWYLSAWKEWSTEAIEKLAVHIHSFVWSLSGVPIVYVLVSNNFRINPYTGFCEINSTVPTFMQGIVVVVGLVVSVFTSRGLKGFRVALVCAGRSPQNIDRLIYRLGAISLGIALPLFVSVLCYLADSFYVVLLRVSLRYSSIIFSALWVFSYKTFRSWNKILRPTRLTHKDIRRISVTNV